MDKCRICLKHRKNLRSLCESEDKVTFRDMITSLNIKMQKGNKFPDKICLSCRKRLREAYNFKVDVEKSEIVLSETVKQKIIHFNHISDVKIEIDYKPVVPIMYDFTADLFKSDAKAVTYKDTSIKKLTQHNNDNQKTQITVKEFLDSVKMESDNDSNSDNDYEIHAEYDPSDSDYEYKQPIKNSKKISRKLKSEGKRSKQIKCRFKPIYLDDVKIDHSHITKKITDQPKKRYRYPPKTSICPYCGKILISRYISLHILSHTSERQYKCDQCSKTFLTEPRLQHHKKYHSEDRKFKCSQCVATFIFKPSLDTHMLVHNEEKKHICDICNKGFKRKHALRRHIVIHSFAKKPIQCELCPMSFRSPYFLRHHMRVHTGERPYKCDICSQPYSYKHDFNRHCLKKHGVFLKRRSVNIMNEEVLQQERALMKELTLRAHGVIKSNDIPSVFSGPQGAMAFEQAMKAVEARQVPVTGIDTTYKL